MSRKLSPTKFTQAVRSPNVPGGAWIAQPIATHTTHLFLKDWQLTHGRALGRALFHGGLRP